MAEWRLWLEQNWFSLLQSLGIVGGLWFTGLSVRRDARARQASDLLAWTQQHRELWSESHRRPELARTLSPEADLVGRPITVAEEEYVNTIIVYFNAGWSLARRGKLVNLETLAEDVRSFFVLPLPHAIWNRTKRGREAGFVQFVDRCLTDA